MTHLSKPVRRVTDACYRGRSIIIQIEPPSIVRVREKGRRTWYETSVQAIFSMAARQHADKIRAERKTRRKKGGVK